MTEPNGERVEIFLAGVQKAGTTSLHTYLAEHPQLLAPRKKETHFFDRESVDWARPDYENDFHRPFYPEWNGDLLAYDATPITIFWPPSIERILDYNQRAKFIFLFRDPIERAFSHWRMEVGRDAESLPFAAAIREGRRRMDGLPDLHPDRRVYSYVERGMYAEQLDRALALVPRDQMLFLPSQDLETDPFRTLGRIADFLSISPFRDTSPRRVFVGQPSVGKDLEQSDVDYLRAIFREDTRRFASLTGIDVSHWLVTQQSTDPHAH